MEVHGKHKTVGRHRHVCCQEVVRVGECELQLESSTVFLEILQRGLLPLHNYTDTFLQTILNCVDNKDPGESVSVCVAEAAELQCESTVEHSVSADSAAWSVAATQLHWQTILNCVYNKDPGVHILASHNYSRASKPNFFHKAFPP